MKNLRPFNDDAFAAYEAAVQRKTNAIEKASLDNIKPLVRKSYIAYKEKFDINSLHLIVANAAFLPAKEVLQSLYGFQNKVIRDIRENIKHQQILTIQTTCQNCTIDSVGTMDHVLPQSQFPEFAINAYNLFPCCSRCNEYKSKTEQRAGINQFLNLYLDNLPNAQYLYVDINESYENIDFRFFLSNPGNSIPTALFGVLCNHYKNLHLFERMRDASITYLSDFIATIKPHLKRHSKEYIIETVLESIHEERMGYGFNYWKCSLKIALIHSPIFWKYMNTLL